MFYKKAAFKNFSIFIEKYLNWRLEKILQNSCFPVNINEFFKDTYFGEHLRMAASVLFLMHSESCMELREY